MPLKQDFSIPRTRTSPTGDLINVLGGLQDQITTYQTQEAKQRQHEDVMRDKALSNILTQIQQDTQNEMTRKQHQLALDKYGLLEEEARRKAADYAVAGLVYDIPTPTTVTRTQQTVLPMQGTVPAVTGTASTKEDPIFKTDNGTTVNPNGPANFQKMIDAKKEDIARAQDNLNIINKQYDRAHHKPGVPPTEATEATKMQTRAVVNLNKLKDELGMLEGMKTKSENLLKRNSDSVLTPINEAAKDLKSLSVKTERTSAAVARPSTYTELKLPKVSEKAIKDNLLMQWETDRGRKPTDIERTAIGKRANEIATNMRKEYADAETASLNRRKAEANIRYMDAMGIAALRTKDKSSVSMKMYEDAQKAKAKHNNDWDKLKTSLSDMNIGSGDTKQGIKWLEMMKQLGLSPELGRTVLSETKKDRESYFFDAEITAKLVNEATGGINVIDPLDNKEYSLGDALSKVDEEGWELFHNPQTKQIEIMREAK